MYILAGVLFGFSLLVFVLRKELRREMIWTGLFIGPILILPNLLAVLQSLSSNQQFQTALHSQLTIYQGARILTGFFAAALASAIYKIVFRPQITPAPHPDRLQLAWLIIGPITACILFGFSILSVPLSLGAGFFVDLLIILAFRKDLIWDTLFSGLGMAGCYLLGFWLSKGTLPGDSFQLFGVNSTLSITLFSVPLEDLFSIALLGALSGPLYLVVKHTKEQYVVQPSPYQTKLKKIILSLAVIACLAGAGWFWQSFVFLPGLVEAKTEGDSAAAPLNGSIRLRLNKPLDKEQILIEITPKTAFRWEFEDTVWSKELVKSIAIFPETTWTPDTSYHIKVTGVKSILGLSSTEIGFGFKTLALPKLKSSIPPDQGSDFPVCDHIYLTLDQAKTEKVDFGFELSPNLPLVSSYEPSQNRYTLTPSRCLEQNQTYLLTVKRYLVNDVNQAEDESYSSSLSFKTKAAPEVATVSPTGTKVLASLKEIKVSFLEAMLATEVDKIRIEPSLRGSFSWQDPQTLVFNPSEALLLDTTYRITVPAGFKSQIGGQTLADAIFWFSTIGPVHLSSSSPRNHSTGVKIGSAITVSFDQMVDHPEAQAHFSISPSAAGTYSWNGNSMSFHPNLEKDTTYTISVSAGIPSAEGGLPTDSGLSFSFSTEESTTLLPIAVDYQDHSLSCEIASLKMALVYRGFAVTETNLINQLSFDYTPREGNVWGDPDLSFVGSIDGRQNTTGYGVHWGPILGIAQNYRKATAFEGWGASRLAQEIVAGNPIVLWGIYPTGSYADPWVTPAGRNISAWKGEHVRLLVGFTGPVSNPTSFLLNDPITGRLKWTSQTFFANFSTYGNRGVVIY